MFCSDYCWTNLCAKWLEMISEAKKTENNAWIIIIKSKSNEGENNQLKNTYWRNVTTKKMKKKKNCVTNSSI